MNSSKYHEQVGRNIKAAREKAKLTQEEVAKKAGLNTNYFAVIERGEVNTTLEKLQNIAKALGVEVSELTKSK